MLHCSVNITANGSVPFGLIWQKYFKGFIILPHDSHDNTEVNHKGVPIHAMKAYELFLTLALDGSEWSTPHPNHCTPMKESPYKLSRQNMWSLELVLTFCPWELDQNPGSSNM
jgi:hypothetical protein